MEKCEYLLFEKVVAENVEEVFLLADSLQMELLKKGCMDYLAPDFKQLLRTGGLSNLSPEQILKVKHRKKEAKKEASEEEKEKKKEKKTMKKISKIPSASALFANLAQSMSKPTPETFFAKRNSIAIGPTGYMLGGRRRVITRKNSTYW
jgi:hypothetical protein